jgi:hypothetical protein
MVKQMYEVFDEFKAAKTKEEKVDVLRRNDTQTLRNVLIGALHPGIKYRVTDIPNYKKLDIPAGMSYSHMGVELNRMYLFVEGNPRIPEGLTMKRTMEILTQMLEALEPKESEVFVGILKKDLKVPGLTAKVVNEAFPGLLPQS